MKSEVLHYLNIHMEGVIVDGTLGDGGHTEFILKNTAPDIRVFAIDRDLSAIERARERLSPFRDRVTLAHGNLGDIKSLAAQNGITHIAGLLMDLGVSSPQLDTPGRGFSIQHDGPLDMRMDPSQKTSAAELLEKLSDIELMSIIKNFGEERYSKRIVRAIRKEQAERPITTTGQLSRLVARVVSSPRHSRIHPATRTFQALRIAVNDELEQLKSALQDVVGLLNSTARLVVISFHSLEDRIVKTFFRDEQKGCSCPPKIPQCICGRSQTLKIITRKPLVPSEDEVAQNPRSISAKLRVAERVYV
ncbi:MAG: 16S rRNA (cytosine(1402)-N(4))-methyltransferase RsmH [Nitrospina sp.]|nr:16S rRNA (cytosine(1402)-N(4))-methyltransferase RsmH [Nitrospina sp.]MBT3874577.1 16S rRNA (cytosine(1402)-N(4))-methyltransferase RsmH [Nitrospina sp.]MBT4047051.1 16S rRNA (cytosine(1402)-N(4))-methyltransferase RsmH [Nitrospina sp.]MBT4557927.1 16S rRNA (cytosine(1402)-N(4))-methyltransferase RsmH [Nitrospina sp.]MBT5349054.1 16S rRNA (cytosine(1402)-N(4))-methyltransferase RsmH [Nitrospina sp.]